MIRCPYCKADATAMHAEAMKSGIDFTRMAATLCGECGEPIIILPDRFRKPTADEHIDMMRDSRLTIARGAWLDLKKQLNGNGPPIAAMWNRYWDDKLEGVFTIKEMMHDDNLKAAARDIFLSGITLALRMFEKAINEADSPEQFQARMTLIEAELNAYKEMREGGEI